MKSLMLGHRLHLPWWWIFATFWLALIAKDDLARTFDDFFPRPPWVSATVEILPPGEDGKPLIRYRAQAHRDLQSSVWTAIIYDEEGHRLASRKGRGDYRRTPPSARVWSWDSFFTGFTNLPPAVPNGRFRICVNYKSTAISGAQRHGDDWCSDLYPAERMTQ